jgi:hypothetical protein
MYNTMDQPRAMAAHALSLSLWSSSNAHAIIVVGYSSVRVISLVDKYPAGAQVLIP